MGVIGGLGIGSLITSVVTQFMSRRASSNDRLYQEKREAYLGLLTSLHDAALHPSEESSKACALWQTRCELFGSPKVSKHVQQIIDTNDNRVEREKAFQGLTEAMRSDLQR